MESENKTNLDVSHKSTSSPLDIISYFKNDSGFVFVYKKTEKLATAVYLITNLFSDNEPMKWSLRKKVSDLLSFILGYKDIFSSVNFDFVNNTKTLVLELVSLLEISSQSGLVSTMNFSILKQEFLNLINTLDSSGNTNKEPINNSLSMSFFDVGRINTSPIYFPSEQSKENHVSTNHLVHTLDNQIRNKVIATEGKDFILDKQVFKRSNRQNIILTLLKKKRQLTIKDISEIIKDCSEKTIQRELISFISAGVIKRTGERRWSRYSLV